MNDMNKIEDIQNVCLRRGIVFPTAEIYPTISGFFDYGPIGTLIKRNFINYWREYFIKEENIVEIDGSTVLPEIVFQASGHVKGFVDPITQCKKCKGIQRADHLIEEKTGKFVEGKSAAELTKIIEKEKIRCPNCKGELGKVRIFNLMLKTDVSPLGGQIAYLRPETAQNIFTAFPRVFRTSRLKLPCGIAQVGHSFRNEISPRHFLVRVREFNQMEIEWFFDPQDNRCPNFEKIKDKKINFVTREAQKKNGKMIKISGSNLIKKRIVPSEWMVYFLLKEFEFYKSLGIPEEALRFRHMLPEETPHYSKGNFDLEIKFDFGWKETVGNSFRTDHDLKNHMKYSKSDLTIRTDDGRKITPFVIEPSFGLERTIAGILLYNFKDDKKRGWAWFKFPAKITPYIAAVFPLVNKDKLPQKARKIYDSLKKDFDIFYDESGSIGRRYARGDEVGIPFAVTIDYQTLEDDTCTIRNRDSKRQIRINKDDLKDFFDKILSIN